MTARWTRRGHVAANVAAWVGVPLAVALFVAVGNAIETVAR